MFLFKKKSRYSQLREIFHPENGREFDQLTKEELYHMVYHDSITNFYNWNYMWKFLDTRYRDPNVRYCFVHFDIKDFKMVNELYGHFKANDILIMISEQLKKETDWILHAVRCDNDNFAIMTKPYSNEELEKILLKFFEKVSTPPCSKEFKIYYRCGVVPADDAIDRDDRVADLAKYAQRLGTKHNCTEINFYTEEMYDNLITSRRYLAELDRAIANDEFMVYLQPKYDINSEKIVGAEALCRWFYKKEKILPPAEFIPIFESYDVVDKIDQIMLTKVCQMLAEFARKGLPAMPVSINLSRKRIQNEHLIEQLCACVDYYKVPHELIEFELTETVAFYDIEPMRQFLVDLHSLGFGVSMDDFGTGYSSLSLLQSLPLDTVKLDKSFVDGILENQNHNTERAALLIKDVVSMTKHLGFCCLAEGAEEKYQVDFLRTCGCDKIQGFYYSKPLPIKNYEEKLAEQQK